MRVITARTEARCPFCKDKDELLLIEHDESFYDVGCGNCGASGPPQENEAKAIAAWEFGELPQAVTPYRPDREYEIFPRDQWHEFKGEGASSDE